MIRPILTEDIFELNDQIQATFDGEVIIVNNIFKHYNEILKYINNVTIEPWKLDPNGRNFKDYYDCRHYFNRGLLTHPEKSKKRVSTLIELLCYYFKLNKEKITASPEIIFNYFKHKKLDIDKNLQHFPHHETYYNSIVYLDPLKNGGTALYDTKVFNNEEDKNLMYDISSLSIKKIIPAIPNTLVMFPGTIMHGGYIEDHDLYYYNWRINLVNFFGHKDVKSNA